MRWLYLLRHAKSSWDSPGLADAERPLTARGRRAAPLVGAYMRGEGLVPDLALSSTARRARETVAPVAAALGGAVPVRLMDEIYEAGPAELIALLRRTPDATQRLLVVGHNPAIQAVAAALAGEGDAAALARLRAKFPTAALAVLGFAAPGGWAAIRPGRGRLERFVTPAEMG